MHYLKVFLLFFSAVLFTAICAAQNEGTIASQVITKNKIGVTYDHLYSQRALARTQQSVSIEYVRQTINGPVLLRSNFARRFKENGWQGEVEAYPEFSKRFYSCVNVGFSPNQPVFPKFRAGFSLFANLPLAFEAEVGFRYLYFEKSLPIYTASIGKYAGNWWFNGRAFLAYGVRGSTQSYFLTSRYYLIDAENYISLQIGRGVSPDEANRITRFSNAEMLSSYRIQAGYRKSIRERNVFMLQAAFILDEYSKNEYGNQYNATLQYQRKF